jgi:hypothetical protein
MNSLEKRDPCEIVPFRDFQANAADFSKGFHSGRGFGTTFGRGLGSIMGLTHPTGVKDTDLLKRFDREYIMFCFV